MQICSHLLLPCRLLAKYADPSQAGTSLAVIDIQSGSVTNLKTKYSSYSNVEAAEASRLPDMHTHVLSICMGQCCNIWMAAEDCRWTLLV